MTREEELDWLCRLRSEIYVYMPREWLIPMNNALDMAIKALEQEPEIEDIKEEIKNLDYLVNDAKYSDAETRIHNVDYLMYEIYKILDRHMQKATGK